MDKISKTQWMAIERLIPLLGKEREWEISGNRHHQLCLWDREEDAPYIQEEALKVIREAMTLPLEEYPLSGEDIRLLGPFLGA